MRRKSAVSYDENEVAPADPTQGFIDFGGYWRPEFHQKVKEFYKGNSAVVFKLSKSTSIPVVEAKKPNIVVISKFINCTIKKRY